MSQPQAADALTTSRGHVPRRRHLLLYDCVAGNVSGRLYRTVDVADLHLRHRDVETLARNGDSSDAVLECQIGQRHKLARLQANQGAGEALAHRFAWQLQLAVDANKAIADAFFRIRWEDREMGAGKMKQIKKTNK